MRLFLLRAAGLRGNLVSVLSPLLSSICSSLLHTCACVEKSRVESSGRAAPHGGGSASFVWLNDRKKQWRTRRVASGVGRGMALPGFVFTSFEVDADDEFQRIFVQQQQQQWL